MKLLKKVGKILLIVLLSLLILIAAADAAWIYVPQIKAQAKIGDLSQFAQPVDAISVPTEATVIALGEASHGNVEFQQLKLSVFQQLVAAQGVRAFALETDFGEGLVINEYIHGTGEITSAEDAVRELSFNIYHTQQMVDLIRWMHDYNLTAPEGQQLSFYGFDLQNPKTGLALLLQFCQQNQVLPEMSKQPLQDYLDGEYTITGEQAQDALQCIAMLQQALTENKDTYLQTSDDVLFLLQVISCVQNFVRCQDNGGAENYIAYNNARDKYMAENVLWLSAYGQSRGCAKLMIAGHDGHIAFAQQFYTPMGAHLKAALGGSYFAIGTDYYKTNCNINVAGPDATRGNHRFCSADPFAANAKGLGGSYYLDFGTAMAQNGATAQLLNTEISMGSLGEGYTWMMKFLPTSHRIQAKPVDLYNAMIFVYEAAPIEVT